MRELQGIGAYADVRTSEHQRARAGFLWAVVLDVVGHRDRGRLLDCTPTKFRKPIEHEFTLTGDLDNASFFLIVHCERSQGVRCR